MIDGTAADRVFLFLQGPHGPFFRRLARHLSGQGARVLRVAFNAGDAAEWGNAGRLLRYTGSAALFEDWLRQRIAAHGVTDIVLYGDTRPVHATARQVARSAGIVTHCFEEGYLRPNWVTYERGGNNANSPVMGISLPRMAAAVGPVTELPAEAPEGWGDTRQHLWHAGRYHLRCLLPSRRFARQRGHRDLPLVRECAWYAMRAAKLPWLLAVRSRRQRALLRSGRIYHLALLQLSFDASVGAHSDLRSCADFVRKIIAAFAKAADPGEWLVVKAHPLEDGRERLGEVARAAAERHRVAGRVVFLDGGGALGPLLDGARSVVTINSTAAQQALWRGLPVAALGRAVYRRPGLVSEQPLRDFFANPLRPDLRAYWLFREFLLQTSQINGSFYSSGGINLLLSKMTDLLLHPDDPYARVLADAAPLDEAAVMARPRLIVAK